MFIMIYKEMPCKICPTQKLPLKIYEKLKKTRLNQKLCDIFHISVT